MKTPLLTTFAVSLALTSVCAAAGDSFNTFGGKNRFRDRGIIIVGGKGGGFGDTVSLNPQPLPPRVVSRRLSFGDEVLLNPQPLPPRLALRRR